RYHLAVIASGTAAHHQRHAEARTSRRGTHDLVDRARHDDQLGCLAVELALEDRRIPIEVAALQAQQRRLVDELQSGERGAKGGVAGGRHGPDPTSWSSSR